MARNATEMARRSDSLYYDNISRRELCDRIVQLEHDLRKRAYPVIVPDEETDGATGCCRCGVCGKAIDMWDGFCRWCGSEVMH